MSASVIIVDHAHSDLGLCCYATHFMSPHGHHHCEAAIEPWGEYHVARVWIDGHCVYCSYRVEYSVEGLVWMIEHVMGHPVVIV